VIVSDRFECETDTNNNNNNNIVLEFFSQAFVVSEKQWGTHLKYSHKFHDTETKLMERVVVGECVAESNLHVYALYPIKYL
jgi:hypothetical protein